jgi:hypothetical protein
MRCATSWRAALIVNAQLVATHGELGCVPQVLEMRETSRTIGPRRSRPECAVRAFVRTTTRFQR